MSNVIDARHRFPLPPVIEAPCETEGELLAVLIDATERFGLPAPVETEWTRRPGIPVPPMTPGALPGAPHNRD